MYVYIYMYPDAIYSYKFNVLHVRSQESVEDIQKKSEVSLSKTKESFSSQLQQLELEKDKLEAKSLKMKEQLNSARSQEMHLRSLVAEFGEYIQ